MKPGDGAEVPQLATLWVKKKGMKASPLHVGDCLVQRLESLGVGKVGEAYQVHGVHPSVDFWIVPHVGIKVNHSFVTECYTRFVYGLDCILIVHGLLVLSQDLGAV